MLFGCCIYDAERIPAVKAAGYDYYEFGGFAVAEMEESAFERLCALTEANKLPCRGFNAYCTGLPAIVGERCDAGRTRDYAARLSARGARLGIRSLGIGAPQARRLPPDYPRALADRQCRAFLEITCDEAARHGQLVLFEAVHSRMCDYANTLAEAAALVRTVERDNLGLVLDFYHMEVMGESEEGLATAAPWLAHVHVSSCEADLSRRFPVPEERPLYARRFAALRALGYDGSVSVEPDCFEPGAAAAALSMLRAAAEPEGKRE